MIAMANHSAFAILTLALWLIVCATLKSRLVWAGLLLLTAILMMAVR